MMSQRTFLELEFSPIKTGDLDLLAGFLKSHPQPLTGYTFATLAAWDPYFHYRWVFGAPETLLVSCILDPDPHPHLLQPVGPFPPALARALVAEAADLSYPLKMIGVSGRFLSENSDFAKSFFVHEDRAVSNYVYSAEALAQLRGRKYSKKRNLLSQATSLYAWTCQPLTTPLLSSCFAVLDAIIEEERPVLEGMLGRDWAALECTLRHFAEFDQQGILISVGGRPVAFSIYEAINPTTVAIHFERALRSYKGLYQVVNWEAAKVIEAQGFEFINREEDLGDPGLRDAKLSYHPVEIVPAYEMTFKKSA